MYLASLPFTFVGTAIVFEQRRGVQALRRGLSLAREQPSALVVMFVISCGFEWAVPHIIRAVAYPALRVAFALVVAAAFVAWSFAFIAAVALHLYRDQAHGARSESFHGAS